MGIEYKKRLDKAVEAVGLNQETTKVVEEDKILENVLFAASQAQDCIYATMDLAEEKNLPINQKYHDIVKEKLDAGVRVVRIGFGETSDFQIIKSRLGLEQNTYTFKRNPIIEDYQRLLMVDKKFLFFKKGGSFYKTQDPALIIQFLNYFAETYERSI